MRNILYIYIVLISIFVLGNEITKVALNLDKLIYTSLIEKLSQSQIQDYLLIQDKWEWVSYIIIPVLILIKTLIIASFIYTALYFFSKSETSFLNILTPVLKAEFIFLLIP